MKGLEKFFVLGLCSAALCSVQARPSFQIKGGPGFTLSPNTFTLNASAEYRADDFLALGPSLLWGLGPTNDLVYAAFQGRLILPEKLFAESALLKDSNVGLELSWVNGLGYLRRETNLFVFRQFAFHTGMALDIFLKSGLSFGVVGLVNFTSSAVERSFMSAYATLGLNL